MQSCDFVSEAKKIITRFNFHLAIKSMRVICLTYSLEPIMDSREKEQRDCLSGIFDSGREETKVKFV